MVTTIRMQPPARARAIRPDLRAFLSLGFRPLYLVGVAWAVVAVALWVFAPQWLRPPLDGVAWHAHEMLWGFVATIAVGFLMTAGANWTGINPMPPGALVPALALWLAARIGFLAGGEPAFLAAAVADVSFFLLAAAALGRVVATARSRRNYAVPIMLAALAAADAAFLLAARQGDVPRLMQHFEAGMLAMAVIALLVARRVIPFFAMRAVPGLQIPLHERTGLAQLGLAMAAIAALLAAAAWPAAAALALAGGLALVQTFAWRPWAVRRVPLLWILYLGYAGLGLGLLVAAARFGGVELRGAVPVHMIAMAGFSVLIIGMVTRTALGHLGRALVVDRSMIASYACVIAAAALRLFALWPSGLSLPALHASALAWMAGFALYLWRFAPWLIRPRADAAQQVTIARPA